LNLSNKLILSNVIQQFDAIGYEKSSLPFTNNVNKRELHFEIELLKVKQTSFHLSPLTH